MQNIRLLKYSHIKYAPFAQKPGGELDGEARQSPRQMEAETLWEGQGKSDCGPTGLEVGTGKGKWRLVSGARDGEGTVSLLHSAFASMSPSSSYWVLVDPWQSQFPRSSLMILFQHHEVSPPSPTEAKESTSLATLLLLGLVPKSNRKVTRVSSLLHPFDHATTLLLSCGCRPPNNRSHYMMLTQKGRNMENK